METRNRCAQQATQSRCCYFVFVYSLGSPFDANSFFFFRGEGRRKKSFALRKQKRKKGVVKKSSKTVERKGKETQLAKTRQYLRKRQMGIVF